MTRKPTYAELEQRISELEKTSDERKQMEETWQLYFKHSPDLICIIGFDKKFKQINPVWRKTLGWSLAEMLGKPYTDFIHPDDLEAAISASKKNKEKRNPVTAFENRYQRKDGAYRWLSWSAIPFVEQQFTITVTRDISAHKKAEMALLQSEAKYRSILENTEEGYFEIDLAGNFTYLNRVNSGSKCTKAYKGWT